MQNDKRGLNFLIFLSFLPNTHQKGALMPKYTESGKMTVRAYTASGALPVGGTVIRVIGVDENNRYINYSIITDEDGVSIIRELPTPDKALSLSPDARSTPYAVYDVEASAPGYYTKRIYNVAVFSGEDAILPINMIPISINGDGEMYPRDTLDTTVSENELL